jgi:hypothetical protein
LGVMGLLVVILFLSLFGIGCSQFTANYHWSTVVGTPLIKYVIF